MNWLNRKLSSSKEDNSRELKRGEIKEILLSQLKSDFPDFQFRSYKNSCYTFQRVRTVKRYEIFECFHIIFALKEKHFACSVASRLNPTLIDSNNYNIGWLNPHKDLIVLKKNTGIISIDEAYYFHNGRVDHTKKVVQQIFIDFRQYGLAFLNNQFENLKYNNFIIIGLDYIERLNYDKTKLKIELETQLKNGDYLISNIDHLIFNDLKKMLQSINVKSGSTDIPRLTFELLELYMIR